MIIGKIPEVYTSFEEGVDYKFGVLPYNNRDFKIKFFRAADSNNMYFANSYDDAYDVYLDSAGAEGEYYFRYRLRPKDGDPTPFKYINVHRTLEGTDEGVEITYDMTPETVWTVSKKYKTIKTKVTGFTDNHKDLEGDYLFTTVKDAVSNQLQLTHLRNK